MEKDSSTNNFMSQVLSMPELLEPILEFSASGEPWHDVRNLRMVCKLWCDQVVTGLFQTSDLPIVKVGGASRGTSNADFHQYNMDTFGSVYPLSSKLPIHLQIFEKNSQTNEFLKQYSGVIANLTAGGMSGLAYVSTIPRTFKLSQMTKIIVDLKPNDMFAEFIRDSFEKMAKDASCLSQFEFKINTSNCTLFHHLPTNITSLVVTCSVSELQIIFNRSYLTHIRELDVKLTREKTASSIYIDLDHFCRIVEPHLARLEMMSVTIDCPKILPCFSCQLYHYNVQGQLTLPKMEKLRNFVVGVPFDTADGGHLSSCCPNLQTLRYIISSVWEKSFETATSSKCPDRILSRDLRWTERVFRGFLFARQPPAFQKLTTFSFKGVGADPSDCDYVKQMLNGGPRKLPECPNLKSFGWFGFSERNSLGMFHYVFKQFTTLTFFRVSIERDGMKHQKSHDAVRLLTGFRGNHDGDDPTWSNILKQCENAITNLSGKYIGIALRDQESLQAEFIHFQMRIFQYAKFARH